MDKHDSHRLDRRDFLKVTGAGVSFGTLAGCTGGDGDGGGGGDGDGDGDGGDGTTAGDGGGEPDPIVVAGLEPQSGPFSVYGPRHLAGAEFAVKEINDDGGVMGRPIEIVSADTESDAQTAVSSFTRMIEQEGAIAAIGLVNSNAAIQTADLAEEREVPQILHAAGSRKIIPNKDRRYTFRTALLPAPVDARAVAQLIENGGYTEIGLIYMETAWGDSFRQGVEAFWPDDLNLHTDKAPLTQSDFVPLLRQMPDDVEVIVGSAHPAGISSMYPQILELGMDIELFPAAITAQAADFQAIGEGIEDAFASHNMPDQYTSEFKSVAQRFYDETGGRFDVSQANGYVAINLIADAIEEAGEVGSKAVGDGLRSGSFDTLYAPDKLEYADWGEIDGAISIYNEFIVGEAPDYYPDGEFRTNDVFRTDPLPPFDPEEFN